MLIELYIFFEIVVIVFWMVSFFTKQEILWAITLVLSGVLAFTSYSIEYYVYQYNVTSGVYVPIPESSSYPYLMGINLIFFVLALILFLFDVFDKYGKFWTKKGRQEAEDKREETLQFRGV